MSTDFFHYANKKTHEENIEFKKKISKGNAAEMITKIAEHDQFDLIVISARGLSKTKEMILGSVSNQVVHKSKIPVLVAK